MIFITAVSRFFSVLLTIAGAIAMVYGAFLYAQARFEILAHPSYSWAAPYSDFEQEIITQKWIALAIFIVGLFVTIAAIASAVHAQNEQKKRNCYSSPINSFPPNEAPAKFCPNCGRQLAITDLFCPNCGRKTS